MSKLFNIRVARQLVGIVIAGRLLVHAITCSAAKAPGVPVIDVTDFYHPHQDVGDNFDILAPFSMPEIDLKAVILDSTETFRREGKGRDAGFIPMTQLNSIFDRDVPCATTPYYAMKSVDDKMLDAPRFQQKGIELILKTLRESQKPVNILCFGSARAIAAAYNRDPKLFGKKLARIHLCAGGSTPPVDGYNEWNITLDPHAIVCLLRSGLPIALYPCAANNGGDMSYGAMSPAFSYDEHNTFYKVPNLQFITRMEPPLRRYLEYTFSESTRSDFLRAMEEDGPPLDEKLLNKEHYVWETSVWICVSGRKLVKRADGSYRIIPPDQVLASDSVLPNELHPCTVTVQDNGVYEFHTTTQPTNFQIYYRGDPKENERALRDALPALYTSFKSTRGKNDKR